jgi:hypothetical protein
MKRVCFLLTTLFLAWNTAFTQTTGAVFAPFVSRLSATVNGRQVRLSWVDSSSVDGPVYIYRSTRPYTNSDAADISHGFVGSAPYGTRMYADVVPSDGKWYYFVAASDNSHQRYTLLIPFSNTIDINVGVGGQNSASSYINGGAQGPAQSYGNAGGGQGSAPPYGAANDEYAPVFYNFYGSQFMSEPYQNSYTQGAPVNSDAAAPAPPNSAGGTWPPYSIVEGLINPPARANITGITATSSGKGIEITFNAPDPAKNAVLYRSIQPLRSFSDLLTATVAALGVRSPYTDHVTPGVPYYYAVVYEDDIRSGHGEIFPGSNSTFIPVEVSLNQAPSVPAAPPAGSYAPYQQVQPPVNTAAAPSRLSEQPYNGGAWYSNGASGAYSGSRQNPNGINTYQTARPYQNQTDETLVLGEPRVFNRDMQTSNDPDDYRLSLIVQGPFMWRDWHTARTRLTEFIMDTSNGAAAERARFYLAQCWYFIGDIRMALSSFLKLQQVFPDETSLWIQASLNRIAER